MNFKTNTKKSIQFVPQTQNPNSGMKKLHLKIEVRVVPSKRTSKAFDNFLASNTSNTHNPPLRTQFSEVIKIELLSPIGKFLLGLPAEPLLYFFPPIGGGFDLSSLVPQLPPLPHRQLLSIVSGGGGGFDGGGDG